MSELQNDLRDLIIESPVFFYKNLEGKVFPISEYTLRNIMVTIAKGHLITDLDITDQMGQRIQFNENGGVDNEPYGMGLNISLKHELLRLNRV